MEVLFSFRAFLFFRAYSAFGGVEDWGQGDGLPRPHATSSKGDRSHRAKGECGGDEGWGEGGTMPYMDLEMVNLLHRL